MNLGLFFDREEEVLRYHSMLLRLAPSVKYFGDMHPQVHIEGDGVAAACCAKLLADSGQAFSSSRVERQELGAVLLSPQTLVLLREIFPAAHLEPVCHPVHKRIVSWGENQVTVPHAGFVVSQADLLGRLWAQVPAPAATEPGDWTFVSKCAQRAFGSRIATVANANLRPNADQNTCWIESVNSGWLFLLPATLIAVGDTIETLLSQSRTIAGAVDKVYGSTAQFPAHPRIASPLCGEGWLACGAAAIGFDPLCGEGTGNAARQAYLATAVVAAARAGEPVEDLLAHYSSRQMQAFYRHLQICLGFYQTGGKAEFWRSETELLQQGIAWTQQMLREQARPPTHRLVGKQLRPIEKRT
jgi:2-polyprenyl-6-methoxyphenol hydroxylase-like FAD-dependent oxidoreductase